MSNFSLSQSSLNDNEIKGKGPGRRKDGGMERKGVGESQLKKYRSEDSQQKIASLVTIWGRNSQPPFHKTNSKP